MARSVKFRYASVREEQNGSVTVRGYTSWEDALAATYYYDAILKDASVTLEDNVAFIKGTALHFHRTDEERDIQDDLLADLHYDESDVSIRYPMLGNPRKVLAAGVYLRNSEGSYELWTNNFKIRPYYTVEDEGEDK